jgi:biphenyl-2,3-diol 1,2-dioxygenase
MSIASLGYLGLEVSDPAAWRRFAVETLGFMPAPARSGGERASDRYRVDALAWRLAIDAGPKDDLVYVGFEVPSADDLARVIARLEEGGVPVEPGGRALAEARGVIDLIVCHDPDGLRVEIFLGPTLLTEQPFVSAAGPSRFVTGDQGLGHIVLSTPDLAAFKAFYCDILGFRLSDYIRMGIGPEQSIDLEFFHCNPRHHTLAAAPLALPKKLLHFMVQVETIDDVGLALERVHAAGHPVSRTLGRHTNDQMVSFYARTPSGFEVEYGYGAITVDDATWRVARHDSISVWGHKADGGR